MDTTAAIVDSPAEARTRGARAVALISAGHFLSHYWVLLLPPIFPLLTTELGVGYVELGALLTVFNIASAITHVPIGFLVDRLGARRVLAVGLVVEGLAVAAMGAGGGYASLLALMAVAGVANSVFHPADYAILAGSVDGRRMGRAYSVHTFAGFLGWAVAPGIMMGFVTFSTWRTGLVVAGLAGVVVAVAIAASARTLREDHVPGAAGARRAGGGMRAGLGLLMTPAMLMCFAFFFCIAMAAAGIHGFAVSTLVTLYDTPQAAASAALTGYLVGSALGILVGGLVADRTPHHGRVAAACLFASAVTIAATGAASLPLVPLVALLTLAGLFSGMVMPSRDMIVRAATPAGASGKVFAFVSVGMNIGGIVAPLLFGWVLDHLDGRWVFWASAAFMTLAVTTVIGRPATRREPV